MIALTVDTVSTVLPLDGTVTCVYHEKYAPPRQFSNALPWSEFAERFQSLVDTTDHLVLVGLNKIITPANRVKVGAMVLRPRKWRRHSVDHTLFVSEPWRAWFHFACSGIDYHGYSYSYLAETDWRAFAEARRNDDPFSDAALIAAGDGAIRSDHREYFRVVRRVVSVAPEVHTQYAAEKAAAFAEEHTLSGILKRLERFASSVLAERNVPTPASLFTRQEHELVCTDLGVDRFLCERLLTMVATTNNIAKRFHGSH